MKKKLILDLIMSVVIVLLMDLTFLSLNLHQWIGLLVGVLFIVHKYLNWNWIVNSTKNIFNKNLSNYVRLNYLMAWLLLFNTLFVIGSGILISRGISFLTIFNASNMFFWSNLHHMAAYILLIMLAIHLGLHLQTIIMQLKKMLRINFKLPNVLKTLVKIIIVVWGIISILNSKMIPYLTAPFKKNKMENVSYQTTKYVANASPSLIEYLGSLFCNGCGMHCPLSSPRCGVGRYKAQVATAEYQQKYSAAQTTTAPAVTTTTTTTTSSQATNSDDDEEDDDDEVQVQEVKKEVVEQEVQVNDDFSSLTTTANTSVVEMLGIITFFVMIGNESYRIIVKKRT